MMFSGREAGVGTPGTKLSLPLTLIPGPAASTEESVFRLPHVSGHYICRTCLLLLVSRYFFEPLTQRAPVQKAELAICFFNPKGKKNVS